jgi:hypothetical protein
LHGGAQLTLAKEQLAWYILLPSETEAGSAGEQPARDSWVTVIEPSSRREGELSSSRFFFLATPVGFNHCSMPKKTQTYSEPQQLSRLFRNPSWFS